MDQINFTRLQELQESFYDFYRVYNLSFTLAIVTCPVFESNLEYDDETAQELSNLQEENHNSAFHSFLGLFSVFFEDRNDSLLTQEEGNSQELNCISILDVNLNQKFSTFFDVCVTIIFAVFIIWFVWSAVKSILRRALWKKVKYEDIDKESNDNEYNTRNSMKSYIQIDKKIYDKGIIQPFVMSFPYESNNDCTRKNIDQIFESTLPLFLKQLDSYLGFEIQQFIDERFVRPLSPTLTTSSDTILQSPRVRKKWNRPQDISPSVLRHSYTNEKNLKNWMIFESMCKRLNWSQPRCLQNGYPFDPSKTGDEKMNILLSFLYQNCIAKAVDWNVSVSILNYSLFLLDQVIKLSSETEKSNEVLRLINFESVGSAADGTMTGNPNHFDVLFVFEFNQSIDLNVLHNNYCNDIPPGYVALGVNNNGDKSGLRTTNCLSKAQIQNKFGFFLLVNEIEDLVDGMVKKAVRKLNTSHKYKLERLPFRVTMNTAKKLHFVIDTSFFHGTGIELSNISVKFIPSICLELSDFAFLPKLYAVPTMRKDHRKTWEEKEKRVGALSKLFPRNSPRVPSNLLWNILVTKLQIDIRHNNVRQFQKSNAESCHVECLMILKGLFSNIGLNSVPSYGHIDINSHILSTVIDFLLMESSCSAWRISQLQDRVSDAVHFLKSAYTNIWLPNFVIHNPHLTKKFPVLHSYSPLLKGRQQNLLADLDVKTAQKTIAFIDSRVKETGLSDVMNEEYSEEMWEYEFFLFG